ncbi:MAG: hypothetical protein ACRC8K_00940 [Waterburya sp.]
MAIMVILSQALYPGREGAETGCRLKNQETEHVINISDLQHNGYRLKVSTQGEGIVQRVGKLTPI